MTFCREDDHKRHTCEYSPGEAGCRKERDSSPPSLREGRFPCRKSRSLLPARSALLWWLLLGSMDRWWFEALSSRFAGEARRWVGRELGLGKLLGQGRELGKEVGCQAEGLFSRSLFVGLRLRGKLSTVAEGDN